MRGGNGSAGWDRARWRRPRRSRIARMPKLIEKATRITPAGNKPKLIDEYVGHVNTEESRVSIAHMRSPSGWIEPGQRPEFDEWTIVLRGVLHVESEDGKSFDVRAEQAVLVARGEWVRCSTPSEEGAQHVAICLPAFAPGIVHRDE